MLAFDDEFVRLETFYRAHCVRVQKAGIVSTTDVQRNNFSVDGPSAANRARNALAKRIANEPSLPNLGHKRTVGAEGYCLSIVSYRALPLTDYSCRVIRFRDRRRVGRA